MSRIRTSLHGRQLGIDHDNRLLAPEGIVLGNNGKQRLLGGPNTVALYDDFLTGLNTGTWKLTEGTDSATSTAAILAGGIGGVLRLTTGDAGSGIAADGNQLSQNHLMWQASNGSLVFETRVKMSAITTCYAFIGFTDQVASLEAPIISAGSANTITTNASDAVGFMFDTRMTDDNWWLTGVKGDTDATHQDTTYAPVAGTYETFRIEVTADGDAVFYRNGLQVGTRMDDAITAATDLSPVILVSKISVTASMTMDIDYIHVGMNR